VALSDPANPLSLSALQDTMQINGRTSIRHIRLLTCLDRHQRGRAQCQTLMRRVERVSRQVNGLAPWQFTYDARALGTVTRGAGDQQRTLKYEYGTDGF